MSFFKRTIELFGKKTRDNFLGDKQDECACCGAPTTTPDPTPDPVSPSCSTILDCFPTSSVFGTWEDGSPVPYMGSLVHGTITPHIYDAVFGNPKSFTVNIDPVIISCLLKHPSVTSLVLQVHRTQGVALFAPVTGGLPVTLSSPDWVVAGEYVITLLVQTTGCDTNLYVSQGLLYKA